MEITNLTYNDISIYLKYDLKVDYHCPNDDVEGICKVIGFLKMGDDEPNGDAFLFAPIGGGGLFPIKYSKAILRPMETVNNIINHPKINNGESFKPLTYIVDEPWFKDSIEFIEIVDGTITFSAINYDNKRKERRRYYHSLTLSEIDMLAQLHFDFKNLIQQNKAIPYGNE